MKRLVYLLCVFSISISVSLHARASQSMVAHVYGMVCAFCAQGIEKKLRALPQTQDVYVNLKQKIVVLELKDGQSLTNKVMEDIITDAGYTVKTIEESSTSLAQIKADTEREVKQ